jgi:hypothetical protein
MSGFSCLIYFIKEDNGYHPDNVEDRSKLYALSKTIQECIIRYFEEKENGKTFGAITA